MRDTRHETTTLDLWLQSRMPRWRRLRTLLDAQRAQRHATLAELREMVGALRTLAREVSLTRAMLPGSPLAHHIEALFVETREWAYRKPTNLWAEFLYLLRVQVPRTVHDLRNDLYATVSIFLISAFAGWLLVAAYPELAAMFASETMIKKVEQGELWTEGLLNVVPSAWLSLSIMTNNIIVTLFAFVLGAFYGLGTLYIIGLNGLMLGGVFAFTATYNLAGRLFAFIVAHGVVELSIICLAGAMGLHLGEALARPGSYSRAEAFRRAVAQAAILSPVCALFLIGAGLLEGNISPHSDYSLASRLIVGVSYGLLLWGVLTGRVWQLVAWRWRR